jgi:hypothetical protein
MRAKSPSPSLWLPGPHPLSFASSLIVPQAQRAFALLLPLSGLASPAPHLHCWLQVSASASPPRPLVTWELAGPSPQLCAIRYRQFWFISLLLSQMTSICILWLVKIEWKVHKRTGLVVFLSAISPASWVQGMEWLQAGFQLSTALQSGVFVQYIYCSIVHGIFEWSLPSCKPLCSDTWYDFSYPW